MTGTGNTRASHQKEKAMTMVSAVKETHRAQRLKSPQQSSISGRNINVRRTPDRDIERNCTMRRSRSTLILALVLAIGSTQAFTEQDEASCTGLGVPLETLGSAQEQRDLLLKQASVCM